MSETPIEDAVTPQVQVVADPEKAHGVHVEQSNDKAEEHVVDVDAQGYVDHTVVIDQDTNKRLRKMINLRQAAVEMRNDPDSLLTLGL